MRVVFDTNILVSAIVLPDGRADQALHRILDGRDILVISRAIIDELLGVLARKFGREREELAHLAVFLGELGEVVAPARRLRVLKDAPENRTLECATAGGASAIVTGDRAMLALRRFKRIDIVSLRLYLESP